MLNPLLVVWSLNVAPLAIVRIPEPASLTPYSGWSIQIDLDVRSRRRAAAAQLQRPPAVQRETRQLNAAPPGAIVVPAPLCVPPDNVDRPDTVSVPVPLRRPPDWVRPPSAMEPLGVSVPALIVSNPPIFELAAIAIVPPAIVIAVPAPVVS